MGEGDPVDCKYIRQRWRRLPRKDKHALVRHPRELLRHPRLRGDGGYWECLGSSGQSPTRSGVTIEFRQTPQLLADAFAADAIADGKTAGLAM